MKNAFIIVLTFLSFSMSSTLSFAQDMGENNEYGFYMKNGDKKVKLAEMSCYSFDELSVVFPVTSEMAGYDFITVLVNHYDAKNWSQGFCSITFPISVFMSKFADGLAEVTLFTKGSQKHALRGGEMTRGSLNYSATKKTEGHTMKFKVYGYSIVGHNNGTSVYSDTFDLFQSEALPMSNRSKKVATTLPFVGPVGSTDVDLSQPCE